MRGFMRFISTRTHGVIDYLTAVLLIVSPWLFDFATGGPKQWVPIILGLVVLGQSLVTDYEFGAIRRLPMSVHLVLDACSGALLVISPWLFGFSHEVWIPHVLIGLFEILTSAVTKTDTGRASAFA
jgi:hypothetical protein